MHLTGGILVNKVMASDANALTEPMPVRLDEDDYRRLAAAIEASARGRDFLAEFARRNRHADTEMLLAALDRLEARMRADGTALERLRDELRLLLIAIRLARPETEAADPLTKAAKLAGLLDMLERRIDAMVDAKPAAAMPPEPMPEALAATLTVVPVSDEPELPIPSPAAVYPPAIALVQDPEAPELESPWEPVFEMDVAKANDAPENWLPDFGDDPSRIVPTYPPRKQAVMPEVSFFGGAHPEPAIVDVAPAAPPVAVAVTAVVEVAATVEVAPPAAVEAIAAPVEVAPAVVVEITAPVEVALAVKAEPAPQPAAMAPRPDPLAAIMALSEDERLALFT